MSFELTDDQKAGSKAFNKFIEDPTQTYLVIQGAAGTGKSTLIKYLLHSMDTQFKLKELLLPGSAKKVVVRTNLTATTNKAVAVLEELLEEQGSTIHSFLKLVVKPDFKNGGYMLGRGKEYMQIYDSLVIIDEASFISNELFRFIDETLVNCKVLLIGDQYQLAPVKQKKSIMETIKCEKVYLNKIMRNSGIIMKTGAQFRDTVESGDFNPIIPDADNLIHVNGTTFKTMIDEAFTNPDYKVNEAKILAWTNERVMGYNDHVRKILGLPVRFEIGETIVTNIPIMGGAYARTADSYVTLTDVDTQELNRNGVIGHMVMVDNQHAAFLPNDYQDVKRFLNKLAKRAKKDGTLWAEFYAIKETWLDLRPAYASTIHKSQGSTYKQVFIDLSDIGKCNIASDVARMLYVGISRASTQVVLYGKLPTKYQGD